MIEVTRSLMVRRSEVSGTPRDGFSRSAVRSRGSPSSPKVRENRRHSSPRSAPGGGSVTRCTRSGGSEEPHRSRMSGISCTAQNHEPMRESRAGSRMVRRNLAYVMWLRCLTFSCHSAGIWRTRSRTDSTRWTSASPREASARSTCVGVARGEDLVAHDRGAVPVPHLRGEPVPGTDGLGLDAAPRQRHQVERGEEVGVEPVGGVEDVVLAQHGLVAEEDVLEVGRARLRAAHVQQHSPAHRSTLLLSRPVRQPGSTIIRIARSSTCWPSTPACPAGRDGPGRSAAARGARSARSPTTG